MANVSISNVGILTTGGSGDFDEYTINGVYNATIFDILGAGGGGGGGAGYGNAGGGGGGGGVFYLTDVTIPIACSIPIVVGTSGSGGVSTSSTTYTQGGDGSNTTVTIGATTYTAIGGGGGGINRLSSAVGRSGGSGGGNGDNATGAPSNDQQASSATGGYGNRGGAGNGSRGGGGGGGGAVGTLNGGAGIPLTITGATVYYGAGGGGGNFSSSSTTIGTGGTGGGGEGATSQNNKAATVGTGIGSGGGGGAGAGGADGPGKAGSNGAVIIAYKAFGPAATGGTITSFSNSSGTYQVHTFTSNGTFVTNSYTPTQRIYSNNSVQVVKGFDEVTLNGGSAYFNGVNNYFTTTTLPSLTGSNFTLEAWINPATSVAEGPVFKAYNSGTNNYEIRLVNNVLSAYYNSGSATITGTALANNTWYHVALVRNGTTLTQYLNGTANGSATISGNTTVSTAYIGRNQTSTFWNGSISNLRLTNTALYTTNFTPSKYNLGATANTILLLETAEANSITASGGANTRVLVTNPGNTGFNKISPFTTTTCGSILFNGLSQYLSFAATSAFSIPTNTTPFTFECWINVGSSATQASILSETFTGTSNPVNLYIGLNDGGTDPQVLGLFPYIGYYNGSAWVRSAVSTSALALNTWYHIAFVFTGSTFKIYINGVDSTAAGAASTWDGTLNSNGDGWNIGRRWDTSGTPYFTGYLTNIRWVKGTAVYTTSFTPPTDVLQAITNTALLLKVANSSAIVTDSSTNSLTITNNNTALYKHFAPVASTDGVVQKLFSDGTLSVNGSFDEVTV